MSIIHIGIALGFVAMLAWGIGDFYIQKSARKIGSWEALFFMSLFSAVILLPFAYGNIGPILSGSLSTVIVLVILCIILFIAALLDFESLRLGKLAVVEPIWSFEVPVSALLAFFILGERINSTQILLIVFLLVGLALVSVKDKLNFKNILFEKGTVIAFFAAILMGAANFLMGWSARLSDPITANFVSDLFLLVGTAIFLLVTGRMKSMMKHMIENKKILLFMSIPDKIAWVAFAFAMSLAPIGIVVALSESYIIIAVILGLTVNKEKIKFHQKCGLVLAVISAIILASITG